MESLTRLLNAAHLLQGKVIALLGDATPDTSDIEAVGDIIAQCHQIYTDYIEEVAHDVSQTCGDDDDDPNRTALIADDEDSDADPNRTAIIENAIENVETPETVQEIEEEVVSEEIQPEAISEIEAAVSVEDSAKDVTIEMLSIEEDEPEVAMDAPAEVEADAAEEDSFISLDELTVDDPVAGSPIRVDELVQHRIVAGDLRRAFTLNDKYRFRRELFGNSDVALNDALDVVSAMHSLDEAREYFSADLGWDLENDDVKDFLYVIATHFR